MPAPVVTEAARWVAVGMRLEREAVRVTSSLTANGVPSLVFKGPVLQHWLYGAQPRPYRDIDVLVPSSRFEAARQVVESLGYQDAQQGLARSERSEHALTMVQSSGLVVDLHRTLQGATASGDGIWEVLSRDIGYLDLLAGSIPICSRPVQAAVCVLHAAQHGREESKPLEDLRRLCELADEELLDRAVDVALAIGARDAFALGADLQPELRDHLKRAEVTVRAASRLQLARAHSAQNYPGVLTLAALSDQPWPTRLRLAARVLWPTTALLQERLPSDHQPGPNWLLRIRRLQYQLTQLKPALKQFRRMTRG
ncbi:MAG: nucleotidyltransferase family protein [Actinomycetota bacterium]|nr:nucleotidyltransferase family protein [Actinomycetota bacterium]